LLKQSGDIGALPALALATTDVFLFNLEKREKTRKTSQSSRNGISKPRGDRGLKEHGKGKQGGVSSDRVVRNQQDKAAKEIN
jgi:hypothetical protein